MTDRKQNHRLRIVPLELRELNAFVANFHRHHKPVQGHRFSIGVIRTDTNLLVGGCSVGRPVARLTSQKWVCEVTRLVTDGTPNACSALYSAAARAAQNMGYERIQTFILDSETGGGRSKQRVGSLTQFLQAVSGSTLPAHAERINRLAQSKNGFAPLTNPAQSFLVLND